jgi:hypothetical protein
MIRNTPPGWEVQTPPCLVQKAQLQVRAAMLEGSGSHTKEKDRFPQWHLPRINTHILRSVSHSAIVNNPSSVRAAAGS